MYLNLKYLVVWGGDLALLIHIFWSFLIKPDDYVYVYIKNFEWILCSRKTGAKCSYL